MTASIVSLLFLVSAAPQTFVLELPLPARDFASEDVNQDGLADIFVLCAEIDGPDPRKVLAAFVSADGRYPATPSFLLELPKSSGALFWSETDGVPPRELAVTDGSGAQIYEYRDGALAPTRRVAFASLLPTASRRPVFFKEIAADVTGDGRDEWLIPVNQAIEVRSGSEVLAVIPSDVHSELERGFDHRITHYLPRVRPFSLPGGGQQAIAMLNGDWVDFAHGPGWRQRERYAVPLRDSAEWKTRVVMDDINGDGLPDFMITQSKGTVSIEMVTEIIIASAPFTYPATPTNTFTTTNVLTAPSLVDVNGDGKLDLVNLRVPFGVKTIMNFFMRKRMTLNVDVHLFEDGRFAREPQYRTQLTVDAVADRSELAYAMGDMTGDGWMDAAFGADENQIVVHSGSDDPALLPKRPIHTFDMPGYGTAQTVDLDGSPGIDVVILHAANPHRRRVDVILF